jgi:tubulin--tyrosine ligase
MLALQASATYTAPTEDAVEDLTAHLTNTCLQDGASDGNVHLFTDLMGKQMITATGEHRSLGEEDLTSVQQQIGEITRELFEAALGSGSQFQASPHLD